VVRAVGLVLPLLAWLPGLRADDPPFVSPFGQGSTYSYTASTSGSGADPGGPGCKSWFHHAGKHDHSSRGGRVPYVATFLPPLAAGPAPDVLPDPHALARAAQVAEIHALEVQRIHAMIAADRNAAERIMSRTPLTYGASCYGPPTNGLIDPPLPPPGAVLPGSVKPGPAPNGANNAEGKTGALGQLERIDAQVRDLDRRLTQVEQALNERIKLTQAEEAQKNGTGK
jgi:hypothetical protein